MSKPRSDSETSRWRALFAAPAAQAGPRSADDILQAFQPGDGEPEWPRATYVSDPPGIDNPILEFFRAYWQQKRGTRAMPARADFRLADFTKHLGMVSLFDALPGYADFRFRVIGTRVAQKFNVDDTGRTLRQAYHEAKAGPARTEQVVAILRHACETQKPLRATVSAAQWHGQYMSDFDALYLPLSDDGVAANQVMSVITFNYETFLRTGNASALTQN